MRRATLIATVALAALASTGCGQGDPETPAACFAGKDAYAAALESAPGEVRLEGSTPISDCLVEGQSGGEIGQVGEQAIAVANDLNAQARKDPSSDAVVQLGYLVGAIQQGASETGGIHADLVRRLDTAARFSENGKSPGPEFERTFGEGYAAGQANG
jgi:hypothetical protein